MSIENEPLNLLPFEIADDAEGGAVVVRRDGASFEIPEGFLTLLQVCATGASLADLAGRMRSVPGGGVVWGRFSRLARFLGFLYDCGLLADRRTVRLAEAIRPDYTWRESIAFEELYSFELLRVPGGSKAADGISALVTGASLAGFGLIVMRLLRLKTGADWPELATAWPAVISFFVVFSLGRSLRGMVQLFLIRALAGSEAALRLRFDALSVSLATDDASRANINLFYLFSTCFTLMILAAPGACAPFLAAWGIPPAVASFMPLWSLLLLLVDLSPFRKSPGTEALRSIYVFLDGRSDNSQAESVIKTLHVGACVSWVIALGLFLAFPGRAFIVHVKGSDLLAGTPALVSLAVLVLMLATIVISLFDDIVSGVGDGGGGDRLSVRRMWRRKRPAGLHAGGEGERRPERSELEQLPFLRQMDPVARGLLLDHATFLAGRSGTTVCRQGDADRTLYILLSGRLAIARRTPSGRRKLIALLEPGAVFGEVAFFFGDRRTADVYMTEDSRLLAIRHSEKLSDLDRTRSEELQLRIWFLQSLVASPLFRQLPADALDALLFAGQKRIFKAGDKVISEGEAGDACYFIIQGSATVVQNFKNINRLKAGDAFGEIALLQPQLLRTASVIADSELFTVVLDGRRFWDLLCSHLPLAVEVEKLAEARLRSDVARR